MDVTVEAENLLLALGVEGVQMVSTADSKAMSGNTSTHSKPVIHIESDSNPSPSSSSTDSDDMPIGTLLKSIHSPSPSSKLQKKPSKPTSPVKPIEKPVEVRISELLELRSSKLPPNHPLQRQTIQPLNMIAPDDPAEQTSTNQSDDNSVLNNFSSHLSGELPNVEINLQKASEVTNFVVASENQQQHTPESQKTPSNSEQVTITVLGQAFPEQRVPEHIVSEQTGSDHTSSPPPSEMDVEYDGMITS